MELAGAIDSQCVGLDAGEINGMEEALEIPVLNDLTMVLGSIAQSRATGVVVDFSEPSTVYDNVKQAAAFGLNSVVYVPNIELDTVTELSAFCEKASMPGRICHHKMQYRLQIIYQILVRYTTGKISDNPARGQILGEDGVRVHSMVLPGLASSTSINFSGPGEIYTLRHDVTNVQCLMPGLILAIRKVVRLKWWEIRWKQEEHRLVFHIECWEKPPLLAVSDEVGASPVASFSSRLRFSPASSPPPPLPRNSRGKIVPAALGEAGVAGLPFASLWALPILGPFLLLLSRPL
ncbi:hypothetical protein OsJ_09178 [Oryza sativa Japonica Group]|uniref:Dihydrodipicolinate reductase N-terminal domain-containing protein n=1 Tax=Oryza sativa subsp. japonica TaxID=39947 RepID=B9FAG5_ORYSJ|nr:hypothetical protein OsJ_09178 [Oryza sativa Japonica Group]